MKKKIFMLCVALVVSAIAVVYCSIYKNHLTVDLVCGNLYALTRGESQNFRYPDKSGKAVFCTYYLYIDMKTNGKVSESETENSELDAEVGITLRKEKKEGLKDRCPKKGNGCNPYSCQEVPY